MRTVQPGEVIAGKYVVQGIIGRGGVGIIAAARHVTLKQLVALKFLRPEIASDPEVMRRFVREAQAAAQIRSEHVARVMDAGTLEDGTVFLVFEHLSGRDLARVLREDGPLPIDCAVDFLMQACEAIAEAHALGIVHRDIKPANLFLTRAPDGAAFVKVLDFGLSKVSQSALSVLTAENHVIGSPHFMSPEQMRSSRDADARSDIWALGVVLFGLLTGRVPFEGEFLTEVCAAILGGKPLSLLELRPEAPAELEAVILHCLRAKPEERIQTVAELAQALHPFAPAQGQGRAARIARVAHGAKLALPRGSTPPSARAGVGGSVGPQLLLGQEPSALLGLAEKAAQHGPSPVSWSISVRSALGSHALNELDCQALAASSAAARPPPPPAASAPSPSRAGHGARPGRRRLLLASAGLSLMVGVVGTLLIARTAARSSPAARSTSSAASAAAMASVPVVGTLPPPRVSVAPSQALPAVSAKPEPLRAAAPSGLPRPPVPSGGGRTANKRGERAPTQVRPAAPAPSAARRSAYASREEELILGLPH
jgi:eukaryotic-like serine/threonine-protein kinase